MKRIRVSNKRVAEALKELPFRCPTMREIALAELMEMQSFSYLRDKREEMLSAQPQTWATKLTVKLDRLTFPQLTQSKTKLTDGKRLGILLKEIREDLTREKWLALPGSPVGRKFTSEIMAKVWCLDAKFLRDFVEALDHPPTKLEKVYRFMLMHRSDIESLRTKPKIWGFVSRRFSNLDRSSFYRTMKIIG